MISVKEAKNIIEEHIPSGKTQRITFDRAAGRFLAEDITALFPLPRFDNSAMDGYAVHLADIQTASPDNPVTLEIIGIIPAGKPLERRIRPGECAQIMTGGQIPDGTDAVVKVENTSGFEEKYVKVYRPAEMGENIRKSGEELPEGELLCRRNTRISAAEIGVLATFGKHRVEVYQRPRVAVFGTGDELIEARQPLKPGKIYNSNLHVLKTLVHQSGAEISFTSLLKDNPDAIETFLKQALQESHIVLSSGGISMGRFDFTKSIFKKLNIIEHFWKVAQKPGKPLFFGTHGKKMIFGLPGNPVSAIISYFEYVHPVIQKMTGNKVDQKLLLPLAGNFPAERKKHRFLFGTCYMLNKKLVCTATRRTGSHMLTSFLNSNCIIEVPPSENIVREGELVKVNILPEFQLKDLTSE